MAGEEYQAITGNADTVEKRFTTEVGQIDNEGRILHLAAEPPDQFHRGADSPPGGQQIVHHQHFIAGNNRILMNLEAVGAILQRVAFTDGFTRQLAGLAYRNKPQPQRLRDRCAEQKPARSVPTIFVSPASR